MLAWVAFHGSLKAMPKKLKNINFKVFQVINARVGYFFYDEIILLILNCQKSDHECNFILLLDLIQIKLSQLKGNLKKTKQNIYEKIK